MLNISINKQTSVATLSPHGALSVEDILSATKIVDTYLENGKALKGVIIYTDLFHGWDSFSALLKHLKFIDNHHKKISRLAFVTNSLVGDFAEHLGSHFVHPEVRHFDYEQLAEAESWIIEE